MVINTNTSASNAARLLNDSSVKLSKSLSRLSSGSRIISPEDDAGGMAVSLRFDAQINRIKATSANVSNAVAYSQTQDGFLGKVASALDRMSELSTLSQDITKSDSDRAKYDTEFSTLKEYIGNIATKNFNGVSLFDGASREVTIDSDNGVSTASGQSWNMAGVSLGSTSYTAAIDTSVSVSTATGAKSALNLVATAINQLATDRSQVGANIARLNHTNTQLAVLKDNMSAANSRIKDVNVAEESTEFARYNILVQAGTAMLAQANASSQSALRLLS
jgi:flagellin